MPKSMPMLMAIFPNCPGKLQWAIYVQKFRYRKLILSISLRILWSFYFDKYSHLILLKLESRVRRWRTTWRFQTFLMNAHLFLLIHDILYAHILYVLHKKLLRIAQKMLWQKKNFDIEVTLRTKIVSVTKKYVVTTTKIMWHTEERFMLTSVRKKRNTCWQKIVPVV